MGKMQDHGTTLLKFGVFRVNPRYQRNPQSAHTIVRQEFRRPQSDVCRTKRRHRATSPRLEKNHLAVPSPLGPQAEIGNHQPDEALDVVGTERGAEPQFAKARFADRETDRIATVELGHDRRELLVGEIQQPRLPGQSRLDLGGSQCLHLRSGGLRCERYDRAFAGGDDCARGQTSEVRGWRSEVRGWRPLVGRRGTPLDVCQACRGRATGI